MANHLPTSQAPIKVLVPHLPEVAALLPYLRRIDENRSYSNYGPLYREFVARLSALTGAKGVTITSNGTTAIELALRSRSTPGGRYCLMPSYTFIASAHAVCNAGLTPYLLEVDPDSLALTPEIAEAALVNLPEPPAAVLVVSAFGAPPDFKAWAAFEARHAIPVVFDAAAAVTAISDVGAQPACVSLHATKVLGIGEGGAILSADTELTARTTAMTGFGFMGVERLSSIRGGNYRISEYSAAVGLAALDALPERLRALRDLTEAYRHRLEGKAAMLQRGVGVKWVTMTLNVTIPEQDVAGTIERLDAAGIEWRRWWGLGCHRHPAFADVPRADLSGTNKLAARVIGLPFHDNLSDADLDRITACLK
ncbi:DegT/DnrJ/EryC1/StrS aminotransferase [Cupriavidus taiwanensis]|uniref:DegT/DnrJ/EryC1/StrS aminotransferase n=1 Tax=Cupriavidus taiwanensis TaxID=164546 RepID=A0A375E1B8_9BURK|nr:DegT/DnrJ/EryC1/StrS aminotransferase [Cupriavidus taiwanensis]SOZ59036.1 DegT/DnrJ/EryC1/StrS aminotransferase [Cupriavidus taiwanensis]SPA05496.1 DegT/DnrJ/EryC1/StrS aminotransferase [Cupriavidus taiwanensis]SPA11757.1 DegT/DnrJ/EryC1/StrS aminotransferase [Cupriavidus taiwanensis]